MPADFVVNCIEVMAVRRPQIWRDECMAVFTQLWHTASLQTLQAKIAVYDVHYRGLGDICLPRYLMY